MSTSTPARHLDEHPGPRVLIAGDSWVSGLSRSQDSVAKLVLALLGACDVLDISKISRTVPQTAELLDEIVTFAPDVALLAIGGADSLVFPAQWLQDLIDRYAPPEWAGVTGLMPPAYLPRDRRRRLRKRVETLAKIVVKQVMINLFGARRRVPLGEVEDAAALLMERLAALGTMTVVVGCSDMGHLTFPRSCKNVHRTNALLERLTAQHAGIGYLDVRPFLDRWDDFLPDRVHLNERGTQRAAVAIAARLAECAPIPGAPVTTSTPQSSSAGLVRVMSTS